MKKLVVVLLGLLVATVGCQKKEADKEAASVTKSSQAKTATEAGGDLKWLTDYSQALEQAAKEKKLVFANFTGSDWCPPCMMLNAQVFSTPEFAKYAGTNFVVLKVDFPRRTPLPEEQQKKNEALAMKYNIEYFPTLVVLDPSGKEVGRMNFTPGGPGVFIPELEKIRSPAAASQASAAAS